jgi:hypothetical protein
MPLLWVTKAAVVNTTQPSGQLWCPYLLGTWAKPEHAADSFTALHCAVSTTYPNLPSLRLLLFYSIQPPRHCQQPHTTSVEHIPRALTPHPPPGLPPTHLSGAGDVLCRHDAAMTFHQPSPLHQGEVGGLAHSNGQLTRPAGVTKAQ